MTKLQMIREQRDMSKYRLAQLSGLSQTHIGNLESGKADIEDMTVRNLKTLARGLGVKNFTDLLD